MELITTYICKGKNIGIHDNMFGGDITAIIDDASAAYAMQLCYDPRVVTLKISELLFKKPVKVGNLIKVYGEVTKFGNTSITLYIEVRKHDVSTGMQEIVIQTNMTFVRIDENGDPTPISERAKALYNYSIEKYGRGLLNPDELENALK